MACCRDCGLFIGSEPIDPYRPCDILEFLLAAILERGVELVAHLPVGIIGYADAAGLGDTFKPCSNVDAVAVNIALRSSIRMSCGTGALRLIMPC